MIVCHCNVLATSEVEDLVLRLSASDPHRIITPGTVFQGCGRRPSCGACMPLVVAAVEAARERCQEPARVRTVVTDPGGVASLDLVGQAADAPAAGERCRVDIAEDISTAKGVRR